MRNLVIPALAVAACGMQEPAAARPALAVIPAVEASAQPAAVAPAPPVDADPEPDEPDEHEESDPLHGTVAAGDSVSRILARAGVDPQTTHRVVVALQAVMDPTTIHEGQRYDIELDEGGELVSFAYRRTATQTARVEATDKGFDAKLEEIETTVREETVGATIDSSLWAAMSQRGHEAALVDVVVDVFAYDIDFFTATRKGDEVRLIVERHEVDGELVRFGRVLAGQYKGERSSSTVLFWADRYVDPEGHGIQRTLLKTPLKYSRVSSGFNPARMHPVLHRVKSHKGVDYAAPEGTPVWAAARGKIIFRGEKGGAGNLVVLQHDNGLQTVYMHLSGFKKGQSVGQTVPAKRVIGYVGKTGLATGAHLHFGVKRNGRYVDPQKVESARGPGIATKERARFAKQRDALLRRLAEIETKQ